MRPTAGGSSRDTNGEGSARRATTVSHYGRMCNPRQGFAIPGEMRMAAERDVGAFEGGSTPRGLASSRLAPPRIPPPDEKRTKGGGGGGRGGGAASSSSHARAVPLGEASPADAMALPPTHVWGDAPPPRAANLPSPHLTDGDATMMADGRTSVGGGAEGVASSSASFVSGPKEVATGKVAVLLICACDGLGVPINHGGDPFIASCTAPPRAAPRSAICWTGGTSCTWPRRRSRATFASR